LIFFAPSRCQVSFQLIYFYFLELIPLAIYTIRVQAFTSMGAGPMSNPVQVKTQQGKKLLKPCIKYSDIFLFLGVPSQPSNFRAIDIGETAVTLQWSKPSHSGENIVHYELYWNDTYANKQHHQ
jgi:receptor-type tyrosine-protein phosphatase F